MMFMDLLFYMYTSRVSCGLQSHILFLTFHRHTNNRPLIHEQDIDFQSQITYLFTKIASKIWDINWKNTI